MNTWQKQRPWALVASIVLASCGAHGPSAMHVKSIRDSAGVRIVENRGPGWSLAGARRVADSPTVSIGTLDGPTLTQFDHVMGALRLPDGRIVVADAGNSQLRFFSASGGPLFSVGRTGSGPGEFRDIERLGRFGADSLYTYDDKLGRLSIFDDSGRFGRSVHFEFDPVPFGDVRPVAGGLFVGEDGFVFYRVEDGTEGRDTAHFVVLNKSGRAVRPLMALLGARLFGLALPNGIRGMAHAPFTPVPSWAVTDDDVYVTSGEHFQLRVFSVQRGLREIIRLDRPLVHDSAALIALYKRMALSARRPPPLQAWMRRALNTKYPFPKFLPAYSGVLLDPSGDIWIESFRPVHPLLSAVHWDVFGPDGAFRGAVAMPDGFKAMDVGSSYVLGRWTDSVGVEHVQVYHLLSGAR